MNQRNGGKEKVKICPNCHSAYHTILTEGIYYEQ
jgi:predicted HNH restriction endonuclease